MGPAEELLLDPTAEEKSLEGFNQRVHLVNSVFQDYYVAVWKIAW